MSLCSICLPDENRDVALLHLPFAYLLIGHEVGTLNFFYMKKNWTMVCAIVQPGKVRGLRKSVMDA